MAKYNWSTTQTKAIESPCSCIVSASAGSGKTTLMIERMLRQMKSGIKLDRMLAVTFTEAQATDMREKLARSLAETLSSDALTGDERERLKTAYYQLPVAQISTLHAFCSTVIRRYFYLTPVGADFRITTGADSALRRAAAIETTIREELEKSEADFLKLYDALSSRRRHDRLANAVFGISDLMDTGAEPNDLWRKTEQCDGTAERFLETFSTGCRERALTRLDTLLAELKEANVYPKLFEYAVAYRNAATELWGKTEINSYSAPELPNLTKPTKADDTPINRALRDKVDYVRTCCNKINEKLLSVNDVSDRRDASGTEVLHRLTLRFRQLYRQAKERDGVLDFHDLESHCLTVLQDAAARNEIQTRYCEIFVDEYQDINPLQETILNLLDAGHTFYVGDIKQSIYGFRLCDPSIFSQRFARMRGEGNAVTLNANYRSSANILKFCDFVFGGLMTENFGGTNYKEEACFVPTVESGIETDVEVLLIDRPATRTSSEVYRSRQVYSVSQDESEKKSADKDYREGQLIAEEIRTLTAKGLNFKAVTYRDIAVLMRSVAGSESFVAALKDNGIPVNRRRDIDLFRATYVLALVDLLKVLLNPYNDYPLLAVMKQFFGFEDDELARIRMRCRAGEFYKAVFAYGETDAIGAKLAHMRAALLHLSTEATAMRPSETMRLAVETTDYYARVLSGADGETQYKLVKRFIAETAASVYDVDLATYLDYLDANPTFMVEVEDNDSNAVTVTTVHKAKGLEYPVVFLARMNKGFNDGDERVSVFASKELGVVMNDADEEERTLSGNRVTLAAQLAMRFASRQEEARILYVALTRAKRKLYLVGTFDASKKRYATAWSEAWMTDSPGEWLLSALSTDDRNEQAFAVGGVTPDCRYRIRLFDSAITPLETVIPKLGAIDAGLTEEIVTALGTVYPYASHPAKTSATEVNALHPIPFEKGGENDDAANSAEIGNAYHAVMQHLDFFDANVQEQKLLMQERRLLTSEQAARVNDDRIRLATATLAPLMKRRVMRETAFLAAFPSEQLYGTMGEDILVQGVADLLIETDNGWILIDYKTTGGSETYMKNAYTTQLGLYASALSRSGFPVKEAYIYAFAHGKLLKADVSAFGI